MAGRTYVHGRERTMRVLNAYLEGVAVQRRYGRGPFEHDELIDAVVRIFWATTKLLSGPEHDVNEELLGRLAEQITAGRRAST